MAALIIFMAGVVGVIGLFASGLAMHHTAVRNSVVAQASEDIRSRVSEMFVELAATAADDAVLPTLEKVPIEGYPGYFYSAELIPDVEHGLDGGVLAHIRVFMVDVGKEKGETFTLFCRPRTSPELLIRRAKTGQGPVQTTVPGADAENGR